jgi:hypothetical protein
MLHRTLARLVGRPENVGSLLGLALLLTATVCAQNTSTGDTEMDRVQAMIGQAKKDAEQFSKSGGKPGDERNILSRRPRPSPRLKRCVC